MQETLHWLQESLSSGSSGPLSISISVALGILSAVACSCCTLPLVGAAVSYSAARSVERRAILLNGLLFMSGIVLTILVFGGIVAFGGQATHRVSGDYWKIIAGIAALLFGIATLDLFPFKLPQLKIPALHRRSRIIGSGISGIVFGGAIAVCSLPCNPGIFIILGAAVLQKHLLWALLNLTAYAIGFSAPLTALVLGVSLGRSMGVLKKAEKIIRIVAGILLIAAGIYLLYLY